MTSQRMISGFALAGFLAVGSVASVFAEDTTDVIVERKQLMKENGKALKAAFSATPQEGVPLAERLVADFQKAPDLFPEGSGSGDTKALPAIWSAPDGFAAAMQKAQDAAAALLAAAQSGDAQAYTTAARAMGGTCKNCHDTYREATN